MIPLHSVLAMQDVAKYIPLMTAALCGVVALIAFIIGFMKGFRRVSWGGLIWFSVSMMYLLLSKTLDFGDPKTTPGLVVSVLVAVVCLLLMLAVYGLLAHFLRPKMKWVKDDVNSDTSLAEYGLEFEPEYLDYDGENDYAPYGKRLYKTGYGTPSFFNRFMGGVTCVINAAMVIWSLVAMALLMLGTTKLAQGVFGIMLEAPTVAKFFGYARNYSLDILSLGLIIAIALKGYEKGFLSSLRSLIVSVGGVAVAVLCFYLPFTEYVTATEGIFYFLNRLVSRCQQMFLGFGQYGSILAKIFAGCILLVCAIIVLVLVNLFLKKCCHMVEKAEPTRIIDGCLACVLYMIIGVVVCFGIWFVLGGLDYFGVLKISEALGGGSTLSQGMFSYVKSMLDGVMAPYLG